MRTASARPRRLKYTSSGWEDEAAALALCPPPNLRTRGGTEARERQRGALKKKKEKKQRGPRTNGREGKRGINRGDVQAKAGGGAERGGDAVDPI